MARSRDFSLVMARVGLRGRLRRQTSAWAPIVWKRTRRLRLKSGANLNHLKSLEPYSGFPSENTHIAERA